MSRNGSLAPVLVVAILAAGWSGAGGGTPRPVFRVEGSYALPSELTAATDLRWIEDGRLWVADHDYGVASIAVPPAEAGLKRVAEDGGTFRHWAHLAVSDRYLAGAFTAFSLWWRTRDGARTGELTVEYTADLDLADDRLLVVGLRRGDDGKVGADGHVAWLGRLGAAAVELRPVLPSASGVGAASLERCAFADLPVARFLADGSFVVVPGADPGVFLYDAAGRLARTWESDALGLDAGCPMSHEQSLRFGTDVEGRFDWLNQRRVVDEILDLPDAIGLVVRSRSEGTTRWEVLLLARDGAMTRVPFAVTSPSKWTRLRGDARGRRAALLLAEAVGPALSSRPSTLVVASFEPGFER